MANTKKSDLDEVWGTRVSINREDKVKPAYADGVAKPMMFCGKDADGNVEPLDADHATAGLTAHGFVADTLHYDNDLVIPALDEDTEDKNILDLITPQSGKKYQCFIEDPVATKLEGTSLKHSITTAGSFIICTTIDPLRVAKTAAVINSGDLVTVLEWL